jgi:hypothetical protein
VTTDSANQESDSAHLSKPVARNFWDTLSMGIKLTYDQIGKYTSLESEWSMDSFYIDRYDKDTTEFNFRASLGYWPDSTFTTPHGFKVAILKYSGPNCLFEYVLVFDSIATHTISNLQIYDGCDRDGDDSPYSYQEYKIVSNSRFETIETYDPGDADKKDWNYTITTTKWKIGDKGTIDSIPGKIVRKKAKDYPKN